MNEHEKDLYFRIIATIILVAALIITLMDAHYSHKLAVAEQEHKQELKEQRTFLLDTFKKYIIWRNKNER